MKRRFYIVLLGFFPLVACSQPMADTGFVRTNYTKSEVYIVMRDGIKLYTAIYTPKDGNSYPVLMQRTPYSCYPYGVNSYRRSLGPNQTLMRDKYIFVYQDARGRYKSEGKFREMTPFIVNKSGKKDVDESSDTYDTIEWLLKHSKNNGKVGMYGISFPGFYSSAALPDAHPALKAVSPQAPMSDEFIGDDCNHNGAFFLLDNFGFYSGFDGPINPDSTSYQSFFRSQFHDAYKFFLELGPLKNANTATYFRDSNSVWRQTVDHDTYDEFWQSRNIKNHLKNIKPAVLVVGGWFDAEDLYGALKTYAAIEKQSPKNNTRLVMGPWTHGAWASPSWKSFSDFSFDANVNTYYQDEIETKFFASYLKGQGTFEQAEATVFETGTNLWKKYDSWPPVNSVATPYYFHTDHVLSLKEPVDGLPDQYISDPARPVPYTSVVGGRRNNEYMAEDQRFASQRPDVLYFQTDSLLDDVVLTGEILANLFVTTTGTDADFIVKLIDVWPDNSYQGLPLDGNVRMKPMGGYQQMVRAEVFRGKFRKNFTKPEPFQPGVIDSVSFRLNEVAHRFKRGHRIMVQVQSSWFPLVDRNPQQFGRIPYMNASDFKKATISIYHDPKYRSNIILPVLK